MGILHKSSVLLGFYGDDLDPYELSALLGGEPSFGVMKGDTWLTSMGVEKVAHTGSWRLEAEEQQPANLDCQIIELLGRLTNDLAKWRSLSQRYQGRFFCGLFLASWNEGIALQPETLVLVSERRLVIDFDIYGQSIPE